MNSIGLAVGGRYDNSLGMISRLTVLILTLWNVMFLTAADLRTGFEQAPIGEIREIKTAVGTWTAAAGAEVTAGYHYMGKQCLHLFGGKARTIEFKPAESVKMPGHLVFQAERWTSRNPVSISYRGTCERQMGGALQWRPRGGGGARLQKPRYDPAYA